MARIFTTIQINRPIKDVFEFMTTPGNWSKWHRRVIWVTGATDHSLKVDEQVTEKFTDAGHPCCVIWTVKEYEETQRWVVDGIDLKGKNAGRVTYTFKQSTNGTLFEREKIYGFSNIFSAFLDWLIIHRRKEVESAEALQRLKEYLEKT